MSELGQALKEARNEQKISLEELQGMTKIQKRYLVAIEEGKYEQLPGKFYARAFVKNYAEAVGLDPDVVFDEYANEIPSTSRDMPENLPPRSNRKASPATNTQSKVFSIIPKLLVAVLILGLLVAVWVIWQNNDSGSGTEPTSDDDTPIEVDKGEGIPEDNQENGASESDGKESSEQTQNDQNNEQTKETEEKTEPEQKIVKSGSESGITNFTLKNTDTFNVKLSVEGSNSWIEIRSNEEKLKYGPFKSGDEFTLNLTDKQKVYFNIGSSPHVNILINGKSFTYPVDPSDKVHQKFYITFEKP